MERVQLTLLLKSMELDSSQARRAWYREAINELLQKQGIDTTADLKDSGHTRSTALSIAYSTIK